MFLGLVVWEIGIFVVVVEFVMIWIYFFFEDCVKFDFFRVNLFWFRGRKIEGEWVNVRFEMGRSKDVCDDCSSMVKGEEK